MNLSESAGSLPVELHYTSARRDKQAVRALNFKLASAVKRTFDVVIASLLLLCLSPILVLCSLLVRLSSTGSVFYKQRRVGKDEEVFAMWKFRSMYEDSDQILEQYLNTHPEERKVWEERIKLTNDPRVTPIGKIMRRVSLDEVPQLWNVVMGDMSLIGPRPITVCQRERYGAGLEHYRKVRPGLTGLWQVSGRSETSFETRIRLDEEYVDSWSLLLDLRIWLRTVPVVLTGAGAY